MWCLDSCGWTSQIFVSWWIVFVVKCRMLVTHDLLLIGSTKRHWGSSGRTMCTRVEALVPRSTHPPRRRTTTTSSRWVITCKLLLMIFSSGLSRKAELCPFRTSKLNAIISQQKLFFWMWPFVCSFEFILKVYNIWITTIILYFSEV